MSVPTTFGLFGTLVTVDREADRPRRSTADAGIRALGGRFLDTRETPLPALAAGFPDGA